MSRVYDVRNLKVTTKTISFNLSGELIVVPLDKSGSTILPQVEPAHLQFYELDPNGIGIYWPLLDEDLSIEGLLRSANRPYLIVEHKLPGWYYQEPLAKAS